MPFNPLKEKGVPIEKQYRDWSQLNMEPYDKESVDPYTQCRVIAMNGIEIEGAMFSHQFARHFEELDLKRQLAEVRRVEQQQQKAINWLTPGDASTLEVTIGYEQVAVDLTAWLARKEPEAYAKRCYEFALLEDFDHLYRYANLMDMLEGKKAERIVKDLTEIMPCRPTIFHHRHPHDTVRKPLSPEANPLSHLHALTIVAAEQQTMNFYMNMGNRPTEPLARALYLEIAQVEEEHVTHYESMLDAGKGWAEQMVLHEYNECYMYYSCMQTETDPRIRSLWETHLGYEIEHLRLACELMKKIDGRDPQQILPAEIPEPVTFESNKQYVREVLESQVGLTCDLTEFVPLSDLPDDHRFHEFQKKVNDDWVPSEAVINDHRRSTGGEYRVEPAGPHPIAAAPHDRH